MDYLGRHRTSIEKRLEGVVADVEPEELREQLRHVALSGGKRVRPTITVLVSEALVGDVETAIEFAVGVEFVHNASLVIDDIIDESEVRRGSAAAWVEYGYGPAIIASDGLLGEAFELFSADERAMKTVTAAMVDLGEGEASELVAQPVTEDEYMDLARHKTGALFRAAAELGAIAADADGGTIDSFGTYAERVGIAFQIRDDVLDATADAEQLGKPTGHDALMDRPSLVEVTDLTPEQANERAREQSDAALSALESATVADSEARQYLTELATFVVERTR